METGTLAGFNAQLLRSSLFPLLSSFNWTFSGNLRQVNQHFPILFDVETTLNNQLSRMFMQHCSQQPDLSEHRSQQQSHCCQDPIADTIPLLLQSYCRHTATVVTTLPLTLLLLRFYRWNIPIVVTILLLSTPIVITNLLQTHSHCC